MKKAKKAISLGVVLVITAMLCMPVLAAISPSETNENTCCKVNAVNEPIPKTTNQGNVLISADNPDGDDIHPAIVRAGGTLVVSYEKWLGPLSSSAPIVYSKDTGETWILWLEHLGSASGAGLIQCPYLDYIPETNEITHALIDPTVDFSTCFGWIDGDIANAEDFKFAACWSHGEDATECAQTHVGPWSLRFIICPNGDPLTPHLMCMKYDEDDMYHYPSDEDPSWCAGNYYDGQSILKTAPASKPEMATGANRMYMVMETGEGSKISYKATVTDLDPSSDTFLFTDGGGPGGMDKYADLEVWPWQMYVAEDATDPDVSASGDNVCIVYTQDGKVKCSYTSEHPAEGTDYEFSVSVVDDGGYPSAYVSGDHVYCAYVKDGNVYRAESKNAGATWGTPVQINDVPGKVAEESGSVDIIDSGMVWTDTRNGPKDIYFNKITEAPEKPSTPDGPTEGKVGTEYAYTASTTDPQGDDVHYWFEWGDGTNSGWVGPYPSGETGSASYAWTEKGDYSIKVKAKDPEGHESIWSDPLPVTMPKNKNGVYIEWLISLLNKIFPSSVVDILIGLIELNIR